MITTHYRYFHSNLITLLNHQVPVFQINRYLPLIKQIPIYLLPYYFFPFEFELFSQSCLTYTVVDVPNQGHVILIGVFNAIHNNIVASPWQPDVFHFYAHKDKDNYHFDKPLATKYV